jgi:hypothetical protein
MLLLFVVQYLLQYLSTKVFKVLAPYFPICMKSTVLIGLIWKRRRYLPKFNVLISKYQVMQIGKKGAKTVHIFSDLLLKLF